jgi:hypothetical protein
MAGKIRLSKAQGLGHQRAPLPLLLLPSPPVLLPVAAAVLRSCSRSPSSSRSGASSLLVSSESSCTSCRTAADTISGCDQESRRLGAAPEAVPTPAQSTVCTASEHPDTRTSTTSASISALVILIDAGCCVLGLCVVLVLVAVLVAYERMPHRSTGCSSPLFAAGLIRFWLPVL